MYRTRVIPCLLLRGRGLVKTRKFKEPVYIGDPVNAVRIFNEKEVDELIVLDIDASREERDPNYELVSEIAGECFMPIAYGGGIRTLQQARKLIRSGVEKVVVNSAALESSRIITEIADVFGSQAVVGAVDVRRSLLGNYKIVAKSATVETRIQFEAHLRQLEAAGAGEIFVNSVDRDGVMGGYDLELLRLATANVKVPVIASGGAGTAEHFTQAVREGGASAVAAGSMFVFFGRHRAVLINYPDERIRNSI
ncbi:MAG: imidazole glycerol-phosphate synthase subunit HisF [Burkholderiales bacterium]